MAFDAPQLLNSQIILEYSDEKKISKSARRLKHPSRMKPFDSFEKYESEMNRSVELRKDKNNYSTHQSSRSSKLNANRSQTNIKTAKNKLYFNNFKTKEDRTKSREVEAPKIIKMSLKDLRSSSSKGGLSDMKQTPQQD